MIMESHFKHTAEELRKRIEHKIGQSGILFRVFCRGKSEESITKKIDNPTKNYSNDGKKIQDSIGVRIVVYFSEDIKVVHTILNSIFSIIEKDSMIDEPSGVQFSVTRYNLIYKLPKELSSLFNLARDDRPIDDTFEVQIRTVLSEGWHEVEHDLRYKQKQHWEKHPDMSRALNAISATLETSESGMNYIFDSLAYRHYKDENWHAMVTFKLKMRLSGDLAAEIKKILLDNKEVAKKILRSNRQEIIKVFSDATPNIPLTIDHAIFIWNELNKISPEIKNLTPTLISEAVMRLTISKSKKE
jgi:ppGpp synthetase/RelA/SpoT-type nucleotidyltranferase